MIDIIIGVVSTIVSAAVLGLFGMRILTPYKNHKEISKRVLHFIRNYEDPRQYKNALYLSLMLNSIKNQTNEIEDIINLIDEQNDLNPFLYKLLKYDQTKHILEFLFQYLADPVVLNENKKFEETYRLSTEKIFMDLKKSIGFPWKAFIISAFVVLIFIGILVITLKTVL